jgi:DNA-binding Xre family transcriptional regulator
MIRLRVREMALARRVTLAHLQRTTGLSISTVRRYWYNSVRFVGLDALEQIAQALDVNVTELLVSVPSKAPTSQAAAPVARQGTRD